MGVVRPFLGRQGVECGFKELRGAAISREVYDVNRSPGVIVYARVPVRILDSWEYVFEDFHSARSYVVDFVFLGHLNQSNETAPPSIKGNSRGSAGSRHNDIQKEA